MLDRRVENDLRLPHPHANALGREAIEQLLGDSRRERLQQVERAARNLSNGPDDLAVIDCILDPVRKRLVRYVQEDVEDEQLAATPLVCLGAVVSEELEPG